MANNSGRIIDRYKSYITKSQRKKLQGMYPGYRQTTADELREQYLDNRRSMGRTGAVASAYGLGEGYIARKQADLDRVTDRYALQLGQQADAAFEKEVVNQANQTIKARNEAARKAYERKLAAAKKKAAKQQADYDKALAEYNRKMQEYYKQRAYANSVNKKKRYKYDNTLNKVPIVSSWNTPSHVRPNTMGKGGIVQYTDSGSSNSGNGRPRVPTPPRVVAPPPGIQKPGQKPKGGTVQQYTDAHTGNAVIGKPTAPKYSVDNSYMNMLPPEDKAQIEANVKEVEAMKPAEKEQTIGKLTEDYLTAAANYEKSMARVNELMNSQTRAQAYMRQFKDLEAKANDTSYTPEQRRAFTQQMSGIQRQYAQAMQTYRAGSQELSGLQRSIQPAWNNLQHQRGLLGALGVTMDEDEAKFNVQWARNGNAVPNQRVIDLVSLENRQSDKAKEFWNRAKKITITESEGNILGGKSAHAVIDMGDEDRKWFEANGFGGIVSAVEDMLQYNTQYSSFADAANAYLDEYRAPALQYQREKNNYVKLSNFARQDPGERQFVLNKGEEKTGLARLLGSTSLTEAKTKSLMALRSGSAAGSLDDIAGQISKNLDLPSDYVTAATVEQLFNDPASVVYIDYCIGMGDTQAAKDYIYLYTKAANTAQGKKIADQFSNMLGEKEWEVLRTVREFLAEVGYGMTGNFAQSIKRIFVNEDVPTSVGEVFSSGLIQNKIKRGGDEFWTDAAYQGGVSLGNNLTAMLLGRGIGAVGGVIGGAAAKIASHAPSALMGASSIGSAKQEALREGYGAKAATMYGILNGVSEAILQEQIGGLVGFGDRGVFTKALSNAVNKIGSPAARTLINQGLDILSEIGQEEFGNIFENINRSITLGEKRGLFEGVAEQAGETAVSTAISTILLNALHIPAQLRSERGYSSIAKASGMSLKDAKFLLETQDDITNGKSVDPKDLARYNELTAVLTAAMPENVAKAIADGKMTVTDWVTSNEGVVQGKLTGKLTKAERTATQTEAVDHTEALKGKTDEQRRDYLLTAAPTGKVGSAYYTTADGKAIQFRNLNTTQKANYVLAQKCAKAFEGSVDVVIHDTLPLSNGAMVGSDGKLHIALDTTNEQGRESIAYWTLAHEAGHALKIADSKAWGEMFDVLTDYAKNYKDRDGKNLYDALVDSVTNQYKYDSNSDAFNDEMFSLIAERMVGSEGEQWAATLGDNTIFDAIANDRNASAKAKKGFLGKLKSSVEKLSRQFRDGGFSKERKRLAKIREQLTEAYKRINEGEAVKEKYTEQAAQRRKETPAITRKVEVQEGENLVAEKGIEGKAGTVRYGAGNKQTLKFHYAAVNVNDLVTSHTLDGSINDAYPTELQPRDRSRASSQQQILDIGNDIIPEKLGAYPGVQEGAPIIGKDMIVESGNGRTIALRYAAKNGKLKGYTAWLKEHASEYGLKAEDIKPNTVLVRVRDSEVNRADFAKEANKTTIATMNATERAQTDADALESILNKYRFTEGADFNSSANSDFFSAFVDKVAGVNEANALLTSKGTLSNEGVTRIQNALFELAYHDKTLTEQFTEGDENPLRNIIKAMLNVAPVVAKTTADIAKGDFYDVNFASDFVTAERFLKDLKNNPDMDGLRKAEAYYEAYPSNLVEENPEYLKKLEIAIDNNLRSQRSLSYLLNRIIEGVQRLGSPNQLDMFGGMVDTSTAEAVNELKEQIVDRAVDALEKQKEEWANSTRFQMKTPVETTDRTDTPAFKEWFGKSKIVDEDGNPLIVYHGTDEDFDTFDETKGRSTMDIQGMFFSPWEIDASGYGKNVKSFYLSIQNPAPEGVAYRVLNKYKGQNDAGKKARQELIRLGYDGVNNGNEEYIAFYPSQIKSATDNVGTFDKNNPNTRYQNRATDTEYLSLAEKYRDGTATEEEKAELEKRVEEAAKEAGYNSPKLYHGTKAFGFTVFKNSDTGAYFFTNRPETASTYSGKETLNNVNEKVRKDRTGSRRGNYSVYLRTDKLLTVDCMFRNWDDIAIDAREVDRTDGRFYGLKVKDGIRYSSKDYTSTNDIVTFAEEKGYDGVVFRNLRDNSSENPRYRSIVEGGKGEKLGVSDVYAVFDSSQIKSADPVTYDDNGDIIPLSERFNAENEDIRYSMRKADAEYMKAVEANDKDWQLQLVVEAGYKAGYTIGAYHGSPFTAITRFDTDKNTSKKQSKQLLFGTHFTQNKHYAEIYSNKAKNSAGTGRMTYANKGRVYDVLLNLGKSLDLRTAKNYTPDTEMYQLYADMPDKIKRKIKAHTFSQYDTEQGLGSGNYVTASIVERCLQEMSPHDALTFLKDHGYNSVLYNANYNAGMANNRYGYDPSIIMLDAERIKSADPVTYDDNGDIIPLSERFNAENEDIRYSMRKADAEYMKAVEDGDEATQARIIEEAAKRAGYKLVKLYHGTNARFNVINTNIEHGLPLFTSTDEYSAGTFGKNMMHFYGRSEKTYTVDANGGYIHSTDFTFKGQKVRANPLIDLAQAAGYDCIRFKNTKDSSDGSGGNSDVYVFLYPEKQLKLSDLITRDDDGNIIPPSKRFDINDEDIRYQQRDFRIDFNVPQLDTKALHEAVKGGEGTVENRFEVKYEKTDSGFAVHITDKDSGKTYDRAETVTEGNAKAEAERAAAAVIRNIKRGRADSTSRSTAGIYIEPGANAARSSAVPVSYEDENGNIRRNSKVARTMIEAGWMTDEQAERFADQVHDGIMSYEPVTNAEAKAYAEEKVSEHPAAAQAEWEAMYNSFAIPSDKDLAVGYQLMANAANDGDFDMMLKLGTELREMMTKAGQAIQSMNLLKQMGAVADVYRIDQAVQKMNDDLMKAAKGYFISVNPDLVEALLKTKPGTQEYDKALEALYKDVASQIKPSLSDALTEYRYLAMLGNPRTHIRNLVGNAVFMPAVAMKNVFGTIFEGIRYGGNSAMKTKALAYGKQYRQFAKEDWGKVKTTIKSTGNKYRDMMSDIDNYRNHFGKGLGWLDKVAKANSKLLEGEDMLFKQAYYRTALAAELSAKKVNLNDLRAAIEARDSGAKMQKDSAEFKLLSLYEEARARAIKEANVNTYNDANKFARDLNAFSRGGGKLRHMMVEGLLPFKNTPANIVSRSIEYSPVGLINSVTREAVKLRKGEIGANEFVDKIARGFSGSAIFALGIWLAKAGVLVGPLGDDKEDKEKKRRGHQAFSVEIAGKSYTLDWMAPVCIPLFTGVALYEMLQKEGNGEHWSQYAMNAMTGMLEPITKMSMLEGIENLIDSLAYSDSKLEDAAITVGTSYLTQFIPTLSGQIARTIDPYTRRTYSDKESMLPRLVDKFVQTVQKKIPKWNQSLQPYVNELGEAEKEDNLWLRIFDNFISPGFRSAISNTKLDKELERLGDPSIYPSAASKSFTYNKATYNLHADEYTAFATARGTTAGTLMNSLIDSKAYQGLTDLDQVKAQAKAIEYANAIAKAGILNMRGILDSDIDWDALGSWVPKANEYAKLSDSPTALADYISIKTYTGGMKVDGSSRFGNVADYTVTNKDGTTTVKWNDMKYDYLQSLDLSDKERLFLAVAFGIKRDAYGKAEAAVAEVPNLTIDAYTKALDHWQDLTVEKNQKKESLSEAEYEKWLAGNTNAFKKYLNDTKELSGQQKFALLTKIGSSEGWEGKANDLHSNYGVGYDDAWRAAYKASTLTSTDEASKNAQYMSYLNTTNLGAKQKFGLYGAFGTSTSSLVEKATAFATGGKYNDGKNSAAAYGKPSYDALWNAYTAYNGGVQHEAFYDWLSKQSGMNAQQRFACCEFTNSQSAWLEKAVDVHAKMGISYDTLWKIKVYWRGESGKGKKERITAYCKKLGLKQSQIDKLYNEYKFLS